MINIEKLKEYEISVDEVINIFSKDQSKDSIDIFIKFKDNIIIDNIITGISEFSIELDHETVFFEKGTGLCLNNKRSIIDPVELIESLEPYIDFCLYNIFQ